MNDWWEGEEWNLFVKLSELFGMLVDAISWKFILLWFPLMGLLASIVVSALFQ